MLNVNTATARLIKWPDNYRAFSVRAWLSETRHFIIENMILKWIPNQVLILVHLLNLFIRSTGIIFLGLFKKNWRYAYKKEHTIKKAFSNLNFCSMALHLSKTIRFERNIMPGFLNRYFTAQFGETLICKSISDRLFWKSDK